MTLTISFAVTFPAGYLLNISIVVHDFMKEKVTCQEFQVF